MTEKEALDRIFMPRSVAIAGSTPREPGELVLQTLVDYGFRGHTYLVGNQAQEVSGQKIYSSVVEIPGTVDYVICCAPADEVLPLLRACAARRVGAVAILTAGFSESGTHEGIALEREISAVARETGLRVMGPNCLGVYCPSGGVSFDSRLPVESGRTGFICQGREAFSHVIRAAGHRGVRFSKALSYGNGCDIAAAELLEYFAQDNDTDTVAVWVENVRNGTRFFRALGKLSKIKPVILLKTQPTGGQCGVSDPVEHRWRSPSQIWEALVDQTGAIEVGRAEELVDVMMAFSLLPRLSGRRIGIYGAAGGASVLATDAWASAGFVLPPVPQALMASFDNAAMNKAGMILHNPLDFSMAGYTDFFFSVIKRLMAHEDFVDLSIIHNPSGQGAWMPWSFFDALINSIRDAVIGIHNEVHRPMVLVMHYIHSGQHWHKIFEDLQIPCSKAGVPVFYSMASAARAIDRMLQYYEKKDRVSQSLLTGHRWNAQRDSP